MQNEEFLSYSENLFFLYDYLILFMIFFSFQMKWKVEFKFSEKYNNKELVIPRSNTFIGFFVNGRKATSRLISLF